MASQAMPEHNRLKLKSAVVDIPKIRVWCSNVPYILPAFRTVLQEMTVVLIDNSIHFCLGGTVFISNYMISYLRKMASIVELGTLLSLTRGF